MTAFRKLTLATVLALTMAGTAGTAFANSTAGNGGPAAGAGAGQSQGGSSSGRVWSYKGAADGVILCATPKCMKAQQAAAPTHASNYPGGLPRKPLPSTAASCDTVRYVYPNGTIIVQPTCPRVVKGAISTHR